MRERKDPLEGVVFNVCKHYDVELSSQLSEDLTRDLVALAFVADDWIREDAQELDFNVEFLERVINRDKYILKMLEDEDIDLSEEFFEAVERMYNESDKADGFVHLIGWKQFRVEEELAE